MRGTCEKKRTKKLKEKKEKTLRANGSRTKGVERRTDSEVKKVMRTDLSRKGGKVFRE